MNAENIKEIIKALSYDFSIEEIAAIEEIPEAEVREIADQHAAEVESLKRYRAEMEG